VYKGQIVGYLDIIL